MKSNAIKLFGKKKWVIYSIALFVGAAMGIITPIATTHMTKHGESNIWIGLVSSSLYFFIALGSMYGDRKMRGKDMGPFMVTGLLFTGLGSILFPLLNNQYLWLIFMSVMGVGISFNLMGVQTALHKLSEDKNRAMVSGIYSLCFALGFVISSVFGPMLYEYNEKIPFIFSAACLVLGAALILFMLKGMLVIPSYPEEKVLKKIMLPLYGAFTYGFSETTLVSLYPMFLLNQNIDLSQIGYALGIFVVGSMIGAVPVTYLADKIGREKCLMVTLFVSMLAILGITLFSDFASKLIFSFIAGFAVGPIYPLTLALSVQNLNEKELPSGTALFNVSYGFGSTAGPFLSALIMGVFGNDYIFSLCLLLFFVLIVGMFTMKQNANQLKYEGENRDGAI